MDEGLEGRAKARGEIVARNSDEEVLALLQVEDQNIFQLVMAIVEGWSRVLVDVHRERQHRILHCVSACTRVQGGTMKLEQL